MATGRRTLQVRNPEVGRSNPSPATEQAIGAVAGVRGVHDLHIWTVGPGAVVCSCNQILVDERSVGNGQEILKSVVQRLRHDFSITRTTVQIEVEGHESNDIYCTPRTLGEPHIGHSP